MRKTILIISLLSIAFGGGNIKKTLLKHFEELPKEVKQQLAKKPFSWKNIPGKPLNRTMMDPSDLLGEWEYEDEASTVWVTVGTDQSIFDIMQLFGMEPAEGGIDISGSATGVMDYMMAQADSYYGYGEIAFVQLSNNPLDIFDDYDDYDDYYDDFPDDLELPIYMFMYMSFLGYEFGAFMLADTVDGEIMSYEYELEDIADYISIDSTLMRVDVSELTVSNEAGDSTYTISGSIAPGTMDVVAGTPFELPFLSDDLGPDPDGDDTFYWQFFEDGTGYDIWIEYEDEGYYEYRDTTEFQWSATNDSVNLIWPGYYDYYYYYYDSTYYYYYYEEGYTISLGYTVENNLLELYATFDYCDEQFGYDDYYYYYDTDSLCYAEMEDMFGIVDIDEMTFEFWMFMDYVGPLSSVDDVSLKPEAFKLHHAYPNPFNPTTTLAYEIGSVGNVDIKVYDVYGKEINSLFSATRLPGRHEVTWDAKDSGGRQVSSGVYLFKVTVNGKTQTAKTLLLK